MGNAVQAALGKEAVIAKRLERLKDDYSFIDDAITGVNSWRENILTQRKNLKDNTQQEYLKILKQAQQDFPSTKTGRDEMLAYLAEAKRRLDNNMRLVQGGVITMDDNTRFRDNLSETFTIASQWMKDESNEFEKTQARAVGGDYTVTNRSITPGDPSKGGGTPTVENTTKTIERPSSGGLEAALQEIQSSLGSPGSYALGFDDSGLGVITFYEQEIDPLTGLSKNKLDANGNPIPIKDGAMSILGLKKDANQRANRLYLYDEVGKLIGENTPLGKTYELISRVGNMSGVVTNDVSQMQTEEFNNLLNVAAQNITATPERIVSVLSENGMLTPDGQSADSIVVPFTKWNEATMANEKIEYRYYDPVEKKYKTGTKPKYIKVGGPNAQNNGVQVPILTEEDRVAAERHAKGALYLSLDRDITDSGTRDSQFDPYRSNKVETKSKTANGVSVIEALNNLRGATSVEDIELSLQKLSGLSGLKYDSIEEVTEVVNGEEIVTGVNISLGGQLIPVEFGKVVDGKFQQTDAKDFINANYEFFAKNNAVDFNTAFESFDGELFENVSQPGVGSRNRNYKSKKTLNLSSQYKVGGKDTTLSEQIKVAFKDADDAIPAFGIDRSNLASGVKSVLTTALQNSNVPIPKGFTVYQDGKGITIKYFDNEGIEVFVKSEKITATDESYRDVEGLVSDFIAKLEQ